MLQTTLGLIVKDGKIFLGEKKRGFAKGVLNGIGGKQDKNETIEECMIREAKEEIGIDILKMEKYGKMKFYFEEKPELNLVVHLYKIIDFDGDIVETEEIRPFWYDLDDIPYDKMWEFDKIWLPRLLKGEKDIYYEVWYDKDNGKMKKYNKLDV